MAGVSLRPQIINQLIAITGQEQVSTSQAERRLHSRDQSPYQGVLPDVVVWPASTQEVSAIAELANEHRIPLVGWGAGTSLEGNPVPIRQGILINFQRMDRIIAIHDQDFQVTVQPGVFYKNMNQAMAPYGLFFAPDPGANATIGGMIANNAAGIRTVKYGATRDNVLALQVVLADGSIIRTGSRSLKQSAGYDLTHLFTGSEGTLGLITEATLKLAPRPEHISAAIAAFSSVTDAAQAVFGIIGSGLNPSALELLDQQAIRIIKEGSGLDLPDAPTLLMEFSGASQSALTVELDIVRSVCQESGGLHFEVGLGRSARDRIWETRHQMLESILRCYPGFERSGTDVAVPISQFPDIVAFAAQASAELDLLVSIVGHAGDGNLHTLSLFSPDDQEARKNAAILNDRLVARAIELGGTCSGEHGIGFGKRKYMQLEHGATTMELMCRIKVMFDPNNILNPGKVV